MSDIGAQRTKCWWWSKKEKSRQKSISAGFIRKGGCKHCNPEVTNFEN